MRAVTKRYAGAVRVAELIGRTPTRVYQLRRTDKRFPAHAAELVEPQQVRKGWLESDIQAYQAGEAVPPRPVERYAGVAKVAQILGVSATRVQQLQATDPSFPEHDAELVEARGTRRGWREERITAYAQRRAASLASRKAGT